MIGLAQSTPGASDVPLVVGCLAAFFLLVILALAWAFVIAPRRARRQLEEYRARGYAPIALTAPELVAALDALTPILPEGTLHFGEGRRTTLNAMMNRSGFHPRFLVHMAEEASDRSEPGTVWRTVFLEPKPLEIETEFSARLTANNIGQGREERLGFQPIEVAGASPDFASMYSVFSKDARPVTLSGSLQAALVQAGHDLKPVSRFNTRFTPKGWAIAVSNAYLQTKPMRTLVDAAERIAGAI